MSTIIEKLATWASSLPKNGHSAGAIRNTKHVIEDVVGCILAGSGDEAAARVRKTIALWGQGASTVVGQLEKAQAPWAALANGVSAHALDYDDTFLPGVNHASSVLVSALLALGEEIDASGAALVDAYIVGLEFQYSLARGVMRSHYDFGWHTTSTIGTIGAAGACARLLDLDEAGVAHALSLGVSMSGGMKVQFGTMAKPLHAGLAAQHAVEAARLAQAGVEGRLAALEGPMGFLALCGGPAATGWDGKLDSLGSPLAIEERGLMVKRFPCCASTHRVLDSLLELRSEHGFTDKDVAKVETLIGYGNSRNLMYTNPQTELEARFSMQYCVGVALAHGAVRLGDFTPAAVQRPEIRKLFGLTTVTAYDPTDEQKNIDLMRPHVITLTMKDGTTLSRSRDLPKGTLKYPLSDAERAEKFADCAGGVLKKQAIDKLRRLIGELETLPNVRDLRKHMAFTAAVDRGERFEAKAA